MSKKIYLYWWRKSFMNGKSGNFGDELSPYIINKLTGKKIVYAYPKKSRFRFFLFLTKNILLFRISIKTFIFYFKGIFIKKYIVSIGSVLEIASSSNAIVWGSGLMNRNGYVNKCKAFLAVRGNETKKRLIESGYECSPVLGDPALLLPLVYFPKVNKTNQMGIIPHYIHYAKVLDTLNESGIKIINLHDEIEKVISNILSCEVIISTSLHGIIVSQAYGIPSLWYKLSSIALSGDNIKFYDYFSSVGINNYMPTELTKETVEQAYDYVNSHPETKIKYDLHNIQKDLLKVAPFDILPEYKALL